jgi:Ca2+-binding EF-hand superfamily protein
MSAGQSIPIAFLVAAFTAVLDGQGQALRPEEADAWFEKHDTDGDGVVNLSEFTAAINEAKEATKSEKA